MALIKKCRYLLFLCVVLSYWNGCCCTYGMEGNNHDKDFETGFAKDSGSVSHSVSISYGVGVGHGTGVGFGSSDNKDGETGNGFNGGHFQWEDEEDKDNNGEESGGYSDYEGHNTVMAIKGNQYSINGGFSDGRHGIIGKQGYGEQTFMIAIPLDLINGRNHGGASGLREYNGHSAGDLKKLTENNDGREENKVRLRNYVNGADLNLGMNGHRNPGSFSDIENYGGKKHGHANFRDYGNNKGHERERGGYGKLASYRGVFDMSKGNRHRETVGNTVREEYGDKRNRGLMDLRLANLGHKNLKVRGTNNNEGSNGFNFAQLRDATGSSHTPGRNRNGFGSAYGLISEKGQERHRNKIIRIPNEYAKDVRNFMGAKY